uniref:Uncharacterized protein n=1 Tax=Globodera rostochiensis TaxID=31243 RepID=A0A914HJ57_GLORO
MFLPSLIQNGTVAPLKEWETSCQKLEEWETSCQLHVKTVSNWDNNITLDHVGFIGAINGALNVFLYKVNKFPIDGMDELLKQGIGEEFNTFIFEVKLELIKKVKWTSGNSNQCESSKNSYKGMGNNPRYEPGTPEFNEYLGTLILNAKLGILEKELSAKIAFFVEQPHIDGDGFLAYSRNFKHEWNKNEKNIDQLKSFDDIEHYRKRLTDLAQNAMNETAPIKGIITKKLDKLVTKCHNAKLDGPAIISDIGMFDGAAFNVLVRLEHEELDNDDFCAELEKAVEQDKEMVLQAYQVKNVDE